MSKSCLTLSQTDVYLLTEFGGGEEEVDLVAVEQGSLCLLVTSTKSPPVNPQTSLIFGVLHDVYAVELLLSLQCPLLGKTGSKICCHPNESWASQHHYSISFDVNESEGRLPHVLAFQQCQGRVSISKECTETANASKLCFTSSSGLFFLRS